MSENDEQNNTESTEDADIGEELAEDTTVMSSILGDTYRGELDRETTWRSRLDQTTTWAVTIVAAILTWAFSSPDNPHYIILIGVLVVSLFLFIEARRYRDYDVYRSRIRLFQQNLIAQALDPSIGVVHENWRTELSQDYRTPTLKVPLQEALGNRLRRIYLSLLVVLLIAWLFRVTAFSPNENPITTASITIIPGSVVILAVGFIYLAAFILALWPRNRQAKGEFRKGDPGEWKDTN